MKNEKEFNRRLLLVRETACPVVEMKEILETHGFKMFVTDTGQAAMECIRDISSDIVFAGVELPDISGYELCKKIKEDEHIPNIPVILLSHREYLQDRLRGFLSGAQRYVCKSASTKDLIEEILFSIENNLSTTHA